jgi:hypothetical protein
MGQSKTLVAQNQAARQQQIEVDPPRRVLFSLRLTSHRLFDSAKQTQQGVCIQFRLDFDNRVQKRLR